MPLFRLHLGRLEDSIKTTIIVHTFNDVVKAICESELCLSQDWGASFDIKPFPDNEHNFDPRIGWYTQAVYSNLFEKDKMDIVGFISEPLEYEREITCDITGHTFNKKFRYGE